MTANEFRNALLLLNCIDADAFFDEMPFDASKESQAMVERAWQDYRNGPVTFYIYAGADVRNALWSIIQKRLTIGEEND